MAGLGLVILPSFLVAGAVAAGELEPPLRDHPLTEAGVHAVSPSERPALRRVRALVEHLARSFGPEPSWEAPFDARP